MLSLAVRDTTITHRISCAIYTASLLALYLSSTLFHSFFATVNTRRIFRVMDKCAIYILIAGSYTPFMQVLLNDQPLYSFGLLGFIWTCCILGVSVEAMYPDWKHKNTFSLAMYMGMGVSCQIYDLPIIFQRYYVRFYLTQFLLSYFFSKVVLRGLPPSNGNEVTHSMRVHDSFGRSCLHSWSPILRAKQQP